MMKNISIRAVCAVAVWCVSLGAARAQGGAELSDGAAVDARQLVTADSLRQCDLLFHASPVGNAITDVTRGTDGLLIDHVGVFARLDGKASVIEALPGRGVCVTPVEEFYGRYGDSAVVAGRVTGDLDTLASLNEVKRFIGCRYDSLYLPGNREIYCSELVQFSFVYADGSPVFAPVPMTFRDASGNIPEFWTQFYARHGMAVPEGWPGTNPGEMSRRKNLRVFKVIGY